MAEIIYGKNTVYETLVSNHRIYEIFVTSRVREQEKRIIGLAMDKGITIQTVDKRVLDQMVTGNHQGIVAKIEPYRYYHLSDLMNEAKKRNEQPFFFILDGLEDPHNLGAILRTAEASGVHGIIIPKKRSVQLNATVAKLSTGAIEYVKVARVTNLTNTIKELKKQGVWVVGTDLDTTINYTQFDYTVPLAVVIGNEGKGMSRLVRESCDALVKIPMKGRIQSLNASVSAAILMYEVIRQRQQ